MRKRHIQRTTVVLSLFLIAELYSHSVTAQSEQKIDLLIETGHSGSPDAIAFSSDGTLLASGGSEGAIKLWSVRTGLPLTSLQGHTGFVWSLQFSPNGNFLASGSGDKTIRLWDSKNGRLIKAFYGHSEGVMSVAFSPDGKSLASCSEDKTVKIWDIESGQQGKSLEGYSGRVWSVSFSPDGTTLASGNEDQTIKLWSVKSGQLIKSFEVSKDFAVSSLPRELRPSAIVSVAFSPNGRILAGGGLDMTVKLWNLETGEIIKTLAGHGSSLAFSSTGNMLAGGSADTTIKLWDVESGQLIRSFEGEGTNITSVIFSSDDKILASCGSFGGTIKLWAVESGRVIKTLVGNHVDIVSSVALSADNNTLAAGGFRSIKLRNLESERQNSLLGDDTIVSLLAFSDDGKILASGAWDGSIRFHNVDSRQLVRSLKNRAYINSSGAFSSDLKILACLRIETATTASGATEITNNRIDLWNLQTETRVKTLEAREGFNGLAFSHDGSILASVRWDGTIRFWNMETGQQIRAFKLGNSALNSAAFSPDGKVLAVGGNSNAITLLESDTGQTISFFEGHTSWITSLGFSKDGRFFVSGSADGTVKLWNVEKKSLLATVISLDKDDWIVTSPQGRFDTNKPLDRIGGLHWIVNDEVLRPLPLDVFMRQYYEPGLLHRLLGCNKENNCDKEFKPLPSIGDINRVQPKVYIQGIKSSANSNDSVDVDVEVESVTEDVSISATDKTKKKRLASGAFDLRLFRDGQLVRVSTPKDKFSAIINNAPRLIAETKASGKLTDTPEDRAWREANDIFRLKSEDLKVVSPERVQFTFRNIKLPHDGRKEVEFTAYAFNSDRVKSTTTEPFKFTVPAAIANTPRKGRAFLVSIGVNASENPAYDLRFAVNDARKMQEIVGARLTADRDKYSEVIQIPLISDYGATKKLAENNAQKAIIKGVFSLLAGHADEVPPDVLKRIPNHHKIKSVEPEDTLIITYSGHGYADQSGIFYLLPYDIGANTKKLTPVALQKLISSDELSLWMQDITAAEMIMIIDACHSSAAVQGDGFKPAPMGSRGLGQLAYDKNMKILSATQADNVALELNSLEQGLLSYALIEDGVRNSLADADKNKQLSATEWLSFGEARVPLLYQEIRDGKRSVIIDGRKRDTIDSDYKLQLNPKLQSPHLFDFRRDSSKATLFTLP